MTEPTNTPVRRSRGRIVGVVITALLAVFLAFDCVTKIVGVEASREGTAALGFPVEQTPVIGFVLLACLVVFLIPRTAVLGRSVSPPIAAAR